MAKHKGQDQTEEDFSYGAFKKHKDSVPAIYEEFMLSADMFAEAAKDAEMYLAWKANNKYVSSRVLRHIERLPTKREKLEYLYQIKADFEQDYPRLVQLPKNLLRDELLTKEFVQQCDSEIQKQERLLALEQNETQGKEKRDKGGAQSEVEPTKCDPDFTMRRKVLALLLLTFGRLDLPEDLTKETVAEFFHFITRNSKKNISDLLANPTQTTGSKRSVKNLCDDLHFVRDQFSRLGMSEAVKCAVSEIEFLLEGLEEKSD